MKIIVNKEAKDLSGSYYFLKDMPLLKRSIETTVELGMLKGLSPKEIIDLTWQTIDDIEIELWKEDAKHF